MSHDHVRAIVAAAPEIKPEPPRPLMRELPPADPFPVAALGSVLGPPARAIHDRVQAPLAICGQSVLAAATLAVQGHADVSLPIGGGHAKPVSNYFVTVAASGERKTECDKQACWPIRTREKALRDKFEVDQLAYTNDKAAWDKAREAAMATAPVSRTHWMQSVRRPSCRSNPCSLVLSQPTKGCASTWQLASQASGFLAAKEGSSLADIACEKKQNSSRPPASRRHGTVSRSNVYAAATARWSSLAAALQST